MIEGGRGTKHFGRGKAAQPCILPARKRWAYPLPNLANFQTSILHLERMAANSKTLQTLLSIVPRAKIK